MKRIIIKNKEKEYRIEYNFQGGGVCYIKAKNEDEAKDMFYDGNYDPNDENTSDFEIYSIEENNK